MAAGELWVDGNTLYYRDSLNVATSIGSSPSPGSGGTSVVPSSIDAGHLVAGYFGSDGTFRYCLAFRNSANTAWRYCYVSVASLPSGKPTGEIRVNSTNNRFQMRWDGAWRNVG